MLAKTIIGLKRNYKVKDKDSGKSARVRRLRCVLPFHTRLTEISLCHSPFTDDSENERLATRSNIFYDISVQTHWFIYLPGAWKRF